MQLPLRIILQKPTAGTHFCIQKGSGSSYETEQRQQSAGDDLVFEFSIELRDHKEKPSMPDFKGPFVQGPAGDRFIYIDIGQYAGMESDEWARRLKIPLKGITREMTDKVTAAQGNVLETKVPGVGKDGGPNCATVKPFDGWFVK